MGVMGPGLSYTKLDVFKLDVHGPMHRNINLIGRIQQDANV